MEVHSGVADHIVRSARLLWHSDFQRNSIQLSLMFEVIFSEIAAWTTETLQKLVTLNVCLVCFFFFF